MSDAMQKLLEMWDKDSVIDKTEPGNALIDIPKLHAKYLRILMEHKLLAKNAEFNYYKLKKIKSEYYSGKMDEETLKKYGWEPFPYILKAEISMYYDSDEDLNKALAKKVFHSEIVEACNIIIKELNSRTFQLRDFISWEKFIQGG